MSEQNLVEFYEALPLKTKLEMARGSMNSTNQQQAEAFVRRLGIVADGERLLRKLAVTAGINVACNVNKEGLVSVTVRHKNASDPLVLQEQIEGFPSATLKTQIMLVAG